MPRSGRSITLRNIITRSSSPSAIDSSAPAPPAAVGRPRDSRIDRAVLQATVELLEEVGYPRLTIAAIAERAETSKPAIYRRWPTKAHLVHAAVFPPEQAPIPEATDLRSGIRAMVEFGRELLGRSAARAALPGLLAETGNDSTLQAELLGSAAGGSWAWLHARLAEGVEAGEVRPDVKTSTVFELIAGSVLVTTAINPLDEIDAAWVDDVAEFIMRGITP